MPSCPWAVRVAHAHAILPPHIYFGLRVRLRDGGAARLRERDGESVVHAGQSKRPQFSRRYLVGCGVNENDAVPVPDPVGVVDAVPERLAMAVADVLRLAVRVPVVEALSESVRLHVTLLLRVALREGVLVVLLVLVGVGVRDAT